LSQGTKSVKANRENPGKPGVPRGTVPWDKRPFAPLSRGVSPFKGRPGTEGAGTVVSWDRAIPRRGGISV
jgi:hypothetical protein